MGSKYVEEQLKSTFQIAIRHGWVLSRNRVEELAKEKADKTLVDTKANKMLVDMKADKMLGNTLVDTKMDKMLVDI